MLASRRSTLLATFTAPSEFEEAMSRAPVRRLQVPHRAPPVVASRLAPRIARSDRMSELSPCCTYTTGPVRHRELAALLRRITVLQSRIPATCWSTRDNAL